MTIPKNDFDPHDLDRLQGVIVEMIRGLPEDRRQVVLAVVEDEPFTFWASPTDEAGYFEVWVGEQNPTIIGTCHVGALRRDDASAN